MAGLTRAGHGSKPAAIHRKNRTGYTAKEASQFGPLGRFLAAIVGNFYNRKVQTIR